MENVHTRNTRFFQICRSFRKLRSSANRAFTCVGARIREFSALVSKHNAENTRNASRQPPWSMMNCDRGPMISVPKLLPLTMMPVAIGKCLSKYSGVIVIVGAVAMHVPMPYSRENVRKIGGSDVTNDDARRETEQITPPEIMTRL